VKIGIDKPKKILYTFLHMFNFLAVMAQDVSYAPVTLGFKIPVFNEVLTFIIRFFFIIAGLVALLYLLLGALSWITSGGNKESVDKAREKIQAALIGLILIFVVLAIVAVIENIFFPGNSGLGITKPIVFPGLIN
jgi:cytochrome bd-type quinol oxidase subunit 2